MTISQLIEQARIERANLAVQLQNMDAALVALSKITTSPGVPKTATARTWTPEQKAKLSASLKRAYAAKKVGLKTGSKAKG